MKNTLKSVLTLALVAGLGFVANAQILTANENATATATVLTDISVVKDLDIAFGNVQPGTVPTLDPTTFGSSAAVGATAAIGKFTVEGTPTASVLVTFTTAVTMSNGEAIPDQLIFTPVVSRTALTADTDGATPILNNGTYVINASGVGTVAGTDHFFVGGTLTEDGTAAIGPAANGLYTGTFTLTVAYN